MDDCLRPPDQNRQDSTGDDAPARLATVPGDEAKLGPEYRNRSPPTNHHSAGRVGLRKRILDINLEKMAPGDPLLIYRNSQSRYTATGRVGSMVHTEYIRDEYWGGAPALDVYVVEEYDDSVDVEPAVVNELLDYEGSFYPQGLWRVADDRPADRAVQGFDI